MQALLCATLPSKAEPADDVDGAFVRHGATAALDLIGFIHATIPTDVGAPREFCLSLMCGLTKAIAAAVARRSADLSELILKRWRALDVLPLSVQADATETLYALDEAERSMPPALADVVSASAEARWLAWDYLAQHDSASVQKVDASMQSAELRRAIATPRHTAFARTALRAPRGLELMMLGLDLLPAGGAEVWHGGLTMLVTARSGCSINVIE